MSLTETTRAAPLDLWREAETLLHQLFTLFGPPEQIAFQHTLTAKAYKLLSKWLRGAEALLRQLLLIEAAALTPGDTHASPVVAPISPAGLGACVSPETLREFWPDKPEDWRVSFSVLMDRRRPAGQHSASRRGRRRSMEAKRFFSAWPLAERAEALLRVFNNPAPYAKRLARKLFAQPERVEPIVDDLADPHAHRGVLDPNLANTIWIESRRILPAFKRQKPDSS